MGKYATPFGAGTASYDMFGDGRDGVMPRSGNLDNNNGFGAGTVNGSAGSTNISVVIDRLAVWRINPGDVVLIHQTRGSGAGQWEIEQGSRGLHGQRLRLHWQSRSNARMCQMAEMRQAQILRVPQYSTCLVTGP